MSLSTQSTKAKLGMDKDTYGTTISQSEAAVKYEQAVYEGVDLKIYFNAPELERLYNIQQTTNLGTNKYGKDFDDWVEDKLTKDVTAEIVSSPDYIVFGTKTNQKLDAVVYVKQMADGTTYYLEEVRKGRETLTATTMWKKMSVQLTAESIRNSVSPNAQSDTDINIIPNPNTDVKYEQAVYEDAPVIGEINTSTFKNEKVEFDKGFDKKKDFKASPLSLCY